jgi:hypothetical protein
MAKPDICLTGPSLCSFSVLKQMYDPCARPRVWQKKLRGIWMRVRIKSIFEENLSYQWQT